MFAVKTNPYIEELITTTSPGGDESLSPIATQFRLSPEEYEVLPQEVSDFLGEDSRSSCDGLVIQKYPNRVLLYASETCAALCRHCTRKRKVKSCLQQHWTEPQLETLEEYIISHDIRDVLISGGDPFMLHPDMIFRLVDHIQNAFAKSYRHDKSTSRRGVIRIGTRVPCTDPGFLLNTWPEGLLQKLYSQGVEYINVQFNCVEELTPLALKAIRSLRTASFSVNNQSVLLKGVNDDKEKLAKLNSVLYDSGIRPYYLYNCDLIPGMSHFRVSLRRGIKIYESLRGFLSGLAIPLYIVDLPDGMGKTPVNPFYMREVSPGKYLFKNYENRTYLYDDIGVTRGEY